MLSHSLSILLIDPTPQLQLCIHYMYCDIIVNTLALLRLFFFSCCSLNCWNRHIMLYSIQIRYDHICVCEEEEKNHRSYCIPHSTGEWSKILNNKSGTAGISFFIFYIWLEKIIIYVYIVKWCGKCDREYVYTHTHTHFAPSMDKYVNFCSLIWMGNY